MTDLISRQDAIRIVDGIDTWQAGWRGDAIESMKALPSAQPEPCEDCVSREAVRHVFYQCYLNRPLDSDRYVIGYCRDAVLGLPSITPIVHESEKDARCEDAISRQAAIDALLEAYPDNMDVESILGKLPSAQPEDCDTCKHGYFGDSQCERCRGRFPSHYERRTDE